MEVMTVNEIATFLHCSKSNIRNMVRDKEIPFFRLGYRIYFNKETIIQWLRNKELESLNSNVIELNQHQIKSINGGAIVDVK